jgi:hypothetical protein
MKHLELIWKIREEMDECDVSKGEICGGVCENCDVPCDYCDVPCDYCGGTGYIVEWREYYEK